MNFRAVISKLNKQQGFTLTELLAVLAIIGILASLVAGAVRGVGERGRNAQLAGDRVTIDTSVARFFTDAQPNLYPVISYRDTDDLIKVKDFDGNPVEDQGILTLDFDARLPQDPSETFVPDFLKVVPDSAALVSWRIDTNTGIVFFAEDGSLLVPPATPRLNVTVADNFPGADSDYTIGLIQRNRHARLEVLKMELPTGYEIGAKGLGDDDVVGVLSGTFDGDNPWWPGQIILFDGEIRGTGVPNEWDLTIFYSDAITDLGEPSLPVKGGEDRTNKITIIPPAKDLPGEFRIDWDLGDDPPQMLATENWNLTIFGTIGSGEDTISIITNPTEEAVYRWLAERHSVIDVNDLFDGVPGNQAVIIKDTTGG